MGSTMIIPRHRSQKEKEVVGDEGPGDGGLTMKRLMKGIMGVLSDPRRRGLTLVEGGDLVEF
jgi:hypothetical protein